MVSSSLKRNNVLSFVLYPYILDFDKFEHFIDSLQPTDIKFSSVHDGNCFFIRVLHRLYVVSKKIEENSRGESVE